jgi:hypothetical protein
MGRCQVLFRAGRDNQANHDSPLQSTASSLYHRRPGLKGGCPHLSWAHSSTILPFFGQEPRVDMPGGPLVLWRHVW